MLNDPRTVIQSESDAEHSFDTASAVIRLLSEISRILDELVRRNDEVMAHSDSKEREQIERKMRAHGLKH